VKGDLDDVEPESQIVSPGWSHVANNLEILADFVFNIVREYEGDFHQRKITLLNLTRYTEAKEKEKKKNGGYGKGFFGWNWSVKFDGKVLDDINNFRINKKNKKKFKKELVGFWKETLEAQDAHTKKVMKELKERGKDFLL